MTKPTCYELAHAVTDDSVECSALDTQCILTSRYDKTAEEHAVQAYLTCAFDMWVYECYVNSHGNQITVKKEHVADTQSKTDIP